MMRKLFLFIALLVTAGLAQPNDANTTHYQEWELPTAAASITNWVAVIPVSRLDSAMVAASRSDGLDIRVYNSAGTELNRYVRSYDSASYSGLIYVGTPLSNAAVTTVQIETGSGTSYANDAATFTDAGFLRFLDFDGDVTDLCGIANATAVGSPTYSAGDVGQKLDLNGTDQYLYFADADDLSIGDGTTDDPKSIVARVNVTDATSFYLASKPSGSSYDWVFGLASDDKLSFQTRDVSLSAVRQRRYDSALGADEGALHTYGTSYGGDESSPNADMDLYRDGTAVDDIDANSGATYTASENGTGELYVGGLKAASNLASGSFCMWAINSRKMATAEHSEYHDNWSAPDTYGTLGAVQAASTAPTITAAVPDSAIHFGGDSIVVTGSAFTDTGTLVLDTDTITPYRWVTDSVFFVSPAGDTGDFNLILADSTGTAKDTTAFRFYFGLQLDSIGPDSLSNAGGTGYAYGVFGSTQGSITVAGEAATVTEWVNDSITYTTPLFTTAGNRDVTVTDFNSYTANSGADSIYFYLVPQISAVSPSHGSYTGGDTVTITGTYFGDSTASSAVNFGDSTTTLFSWSDTSIQTIIKAGSGTVAVSVTGSDGFSDTLSDAYTFDAKPVVDSISPTGGSRKLANAVTIYGSGFLSTQGTGYAAIEDADSTLTITTWSDTLITGTARTGTAGAQPVIAFNSNGDGDTLATAFTFDSVPVLQTISPTKGTPEGGTTVTLTGVDFEAAQGTGTVTFGGTAAASYTSWADGEVVVVTDAKDAGTYDVILTTTGALADTLSDAYIYGIDSYIGPWRPQGHNRLRRASQSVRRRYNLR